MQVLGLDLSLSSSGWCQLNYETGLPDATGIIKSDAKLRTEDRMYGIATEILSLVTEDISNVFVEYPLIAHSAVTSKRLNQLYGFVVCRIYHLVPTVEVAVGTLKKWATGKGNAKKPEMMEAAFQKTGIEFLSDDIADATLCALWGRELVMEAVANG